MSLLLMFDPLLIAAICCYAFLCHFLLAAASAGALRKEIDPALRRDLPLYPSALERAEYQIASSTVRFHMFFWVPAAIALVGYWFCMDDYTRSAQGAPRYSMFLVGIAITVASWLITVFPYGGLLLGALRYIAASKCRSNSVLPWHTAPMLAILASMLSFGVMALLGDFACIAWPLLILVGIVVAFMGRRALISAYPYNDEPEDHWDY